MGAAPTSSLADPALRRALATMARRRVPPHEVDEIVQATLTEAIASPHRPEDGEVLRRWVHGIARYKIADFHRRSRREELGFDERDPEHEYGSLDATGALAATDAAHDAVDLLRWAEREAPSQGDAARTLEWMVREGEGEKLESIAQDEAVPAPQVRQRVARMRRHYRTRWAAQVAAVAALLAIVALTLWLVRRKLEVIRPGRATEFVDPIARGAAILAESRAAADSMKTAPPPAPAPDYAPNVKNGKSGFPMPKVTPKPPATTKKLLVDDDHK